MKIYIESIAAVFAFGGLAYFRAPLWIWTLTFASTLASIIALDAIGHFSSIFLAVALFAWVAVFHIPLIRERTLTPHIRQWFQKVLPAVSVTEEEALEAGEIWWEAELFQGNPRWQNLASFVTPRLTAEEASFVKHQLPTLCGLIQDWQSSTHNLDLTDQAWDYLKKEKFFGLVIPKSYGGLGFSHFATSTIVQTLATHSLSAAITTMVPNSLGPAELLQKYGTDLQKQHYLPRLAAGDEVPCFALTGPEAGSDAGAMRDIGIVCQGVYEGKEVLGIRLTWNKRYITLAPVATLVGIAFKLQDPDGLLGQKASLGITLALLPANHPGVEIGMRHFPLGQSFMNGPTRGKDVFIPLDWIIGGPSMIGKGWRMLVECLSAGRGISLPALSTAVGKLCYRSTGAYASIRSQFNTPIGRFEGVVQALARIAGLTYLLEANRILTAGAVDSHMRPAVATAIAKYHMTEMARIVLNDAMDIHGGRGIMLGPNNYLGRVYQGWPIAITVEGANILTRNLMIFGQGVVRCHPYIRVEMQAAAQNTPESLKIFAEAFFGHIGYAISNVAKLLAGHFLWPFVMFKAKTPIQRYQTSLNRLSIALSVVSEVALLFLGGQLKRKERLSARLGDVLSYLYLASGALKYYSKSQNNQEEAPYLEWALRYCLTQAQKAFFEFFANFQGTMGRVLQCLIFPWGAPFKAASDALDQQLASSMMSLSYMRAHLGDGCYVGNEQEGLGLLEKAFQALQAAQPALNKIATRQNKGLLSKQLTFKEKLQLGLQEQWLTSEDELLLNLWESLRWQAIQVDEFSETQLQRTA